MYPEYDPNEQSLGQSFADMLRGFKNPQAYQDVGQGLINTAKVVPNVIESLGRGGVAQAVGTMGDFRDLRNTVQSYLPQGVQNFSNAAEFLTNPYAKALIQTAPTTEQTLDAVPRATAPYEGYKQHETLGEYIAPSLGYFAGKGAKQAVDTFGPKAAEMSENYLRSIGGIADIVPPQPAKVAEALRQPEKNALGFYSPLDEAVMNLQNQKGTGQQYLAQLLKTQGVKQEEVATRGLDTFLESNPKVTREQMAQYLRENPVELKETVLGADTKRNLNSVSEQDYQLRGGDVIDDTDYIDDMANDEYFNIKNDPDLLEEYRLKAYEDTGIDPADMDLSQSNEIDDLVDNMIRERAETYANDSYYENPQLKYYDDIGYEVTGSDDVGYYITDPNGREVPTGRNGIYDIGDAESAIREDAMNQGLMFYSDEEYGTKYHDYTLPNGENYREVLIQLPESQPRAKNLDEAFDMWMADAKAGKRGQYTPKELASITKDDIQDILKEDYLTAKRSGNYNSGHFDEPNILAHFRTTDRTIDGKKTLFVEEIQSDWHQAGRKKGYDTPEVRQNIAKKRQRLLDQKDYYAKLAEPYAAEGKDSPPDVIEGWTKAANGLQELQKVENSMANAVPNAPFKKNWQELAMKRAMQMATEGGYERVAFTTGKQQADRYSLSKQIDEVVAYPDNTIGAFKDGRNVLSKSYKDENELSDLIGKEAAKKLLETKADMNGQRILSGVDLDVGGEGMKGFYDKILPDFINKYGKKNGLKVGKTSLKDGPVYRDFNYWAAKKDPSMSNTFIKDSFDKKDDLYKEYLKEGLAKDQEAVHYFDLTPEAKESFLKKGQPMFAAAPAIGITDEDTRREVLEKLFNSKK